MNTENPAAFSQRVIHDLKTRSLPGVVFYPLLAAIIIFTDDFYARQTAFCLLFGVSFAAICLLRLIHLMVAPWMEKTHQRLSHAIFHASVGISGSIWGACFAYLILLEGEHTTRMLATICTAGLSAAGSVAFLPSVRLAVGYNCAMLVPAIVLMSIRQTDLPLVLAFFLFFIYLILMANRGHREYWQALENERLLIAQSEALDRLSRIDSLTGLYNRRHFDEHIDQVWKTSSRVQRPPTVIICDLDHFKAINDRYGHQTGDEILKRTARLLKTVFKRETDTIARFGGEEFIVLLTDSTPRRSLDLAEAVRRRFAETPMPCKGGHVSASMSIGIASALPDIDESRDALIARADDALYRAKENGRNQIVVAPRSNRPDEPYP